MDFNICHIIYFQSGIYRQSSQCQYSRSAQFYYRYRIFGILYIRVIETNEVIEGILVGMVFIIIDIILDMAIFILPNNKVPFVENYPLHVFSMVIITLLITTFLGYLAQMKIDLK